MNVQRMIDTHLARRQRRASAPSATGFQLDAMRLELPRSTGNPHAEEEARIFDAHLTYVFERLITERQRDILFALRTPIGEEPYEREVRDGDLHIVVRSMPDGTDERTQETYAGERFLRASRDAEGEPIEGFSVVLGGRPTYLTREQVAVAFGMTFDEVKREIRIAYRTIRASQQFEALADSDL